MPELPEAETIARTLAPHLEGRCIVAALFLSERVYRGNPAPELAGRTIVRVGRHGKTVVCELDRGCLAFHLGMTGQLLLGGGAGPHTRAILSLDDGAVRFDDVRQFGRLRLLDAPPARVGPDALALVPGQLAGMLHGRRGALKPLLLNQEFVRGIGNIYADEILFRARLHPRAVAARLGAARAEQMERAIHEVLTEAIAAGGSSVSDYVDAEGRRGSFQLLHRVYRKTGQPCPSCGAAIRRIVVAQRGTHYCPRCQRV